MRYSGSQYLLKRPLAAILNSRQSKRPLGSDSWVVKTMETVRFCKANNLTILASVGINTYELVLYGAAKLSCPVIVTLPFPKKPALDISRLINEFHLNEENTGFYYPEENVISRKSNMLTRDEFIISLSDMIYPVSIKNNGNLAGLISRCANQKCIIDYFTIPYRSRQRNLKEDYTEMCVSEWAGNESWNYLTHWTRTSNGPWPGETAYDYYNAVVSSNEHYARSGRHTLCRILKEKRIRASGKHLHKGLKATAFSELKPADIIPMMRWQPRLVSMSFEAYGIAIEKGCAEKMGVKRVLYGSPEMYNVLSDNDKPFFHSIGEKTDWMPEREYRHVGDFSLDKVPPNEVKIIVRDKSEVSEAKNFTDSEILSLFG